MKSKRIVIKPEARSLLLLAFAKRLARLTIAFAKRLARLTICNRSLLLLAFAKRLVHGQKRAKTTEKELQSKGFQVEVQRKDFKWRCQGTEVKRISRSMPRKCTCEATKVRAAHNQDCSRKQREDKQTCGSLLLLGKAFFAFAKRLCCGLSSGIDAFGAKRPAPLVELAIGKSPLETAAALGEPLVQASLGLGMPVH